MSLPPASECCPSCGLPASRCVCSWVRPVKTSTEVLILQHPQEVSEELGSARLAQLALPRCTLRTGLSWPNLSSALGRQARGQDWLVLYLGSVRPRGPGGPLIPVDRRGKPQPVPADWRVSGLVVLDGTWSQAKTLWWRNAWLLRLQRAVLSPARPSLYRQLRREPRRESLSTIESIAVALSVLEQRPSLAEELLLPFQKMLEGHRLR